MDFHKHTGYAYAGRRLCKDRDKLPLAAAACTECVASNTTGWPVRFIISRERISTTRLPYPKEVPRSHKEMLSFPAAFAFFRILAISQGARNWPFFMLTGFPVAATASMRSVWRQRNAGVWSISTTSATGAACSGL